MSSRERSRGDVSVPALRRAAEERGERVGELLLGAVPLAVQRVGIGLGYHVMEQLVRQHPGGGV
ncbi:MAG: hypothetical protein Q7T33_09085, partial [Dehalococcoidia bacterium]|nr:hypothetical protein [Dehalococcoidia bacterium]